MKNVKKLNISRSLRLFDDGKELIPGGVLGIRRPYNFVEGEYPVYVESGKGVETRAERRVTALVVFGAFILVG